MVNLKMNKLKIIMTIGMLLLSGLTIISTNAEDTIIVTSTGNTLYVGGDGPGNYTTIQGAIDDAESGDTVFVFSGTYYETLSITKSINLIGEDENSTIIDSDYDGCSIDIQQEYVNISGFTMQNSWEFIRIVSSYNNIYDNIFYAENSTIKINDCGHNKISNNIFYGIELLCQNSEYNVISSNKIDSLFLSFEFSSYNTIRDNEIISNSKWVIKFYFSNDSIVDHNHLRYIDIIGSHHNTIINNIVESEGYYGWIFHLSGSNYNNITNNEITNGTFYFGGSVSNTLRKNKFINCNIEAGDYIANPDNLYNDIDSSNTINDKPIYWYVDKTGINIPSDAGLIVLVNCSNFVISKVEITKKSDFGVLLFNSNNTIIKRSTFYSNMFSIFLIQSNNTKIVDNIFNDSFYGVYIYKSNCSIIKGNTLKNNYAGIVSEDSYNNQIFHNNLFNIINAGESGKNEWNSSFGEGNYWGDFDEPSEGAYDNNSDGIVDTPYYIPHSDDKDNYPLMKPYTKQLEVTIVRGINRGVFIDIKNLGENYSIDDINYKISVAGGALGFINSTTEGTIPLIKAENKTTVNATAFGFGIIKIDIAVDDSIVEKDYGLIFGRLVIIPRFFNIIPRS